MGLHVLHLHIGGFAIGLDRIAMILCKDNKINSVTAFPKTPDCRDLLTNGPKKDKKEDEIEK